MLLGMREKNTYLNFILKDVLSECCFYLETRVILNLLSCGQINSLSC